MQLRRALLTGLVVALAGTTFVAPTATAAPAKKVCNLISDETGDQTAYLTLIGSETLDLVTGDLATGKSQLVAVLRLKSTKFRDSMWWDHWSFSWNIGANLNGIDYDFKYTVPAGETAGVPSVVVGTTRPKFDFKVEGNNLVWKVDRKLLPSLNKKPGQKFGRFSATSTLGGETRDTAVEYTKTYTDKTPSCVVAK